MNPTNLSSGGDDRANGSTPVPQPQPNSSPQSAHSQGTQQAAAANLIRTQIDSLYNGNTVAEAPQAAQAASTPAHTYDRTHSTTQPHIQADQWKAYHSAWQTYYQKYYEAYYEHKRKQEKAAEAAQAEQAATAQSHELESAQPQNEGYFSEQSSARSNQQPEPEADITKDEALYDLRQSLLNKVQTQAKKVRKSKHFMPIAASLAVVLVFVFLQYNRVLIASVNAYVSPGSIDVQNIVIDPTASVEVGSDPRLVIPKINVDVPAIYGVGTDHDSQMAAMEKGVAHFGIPGANSRPGEVGNTVLSGHSSNDLFDRGDFKFIFAQLDKLVEGDTIYANYEGVRYTYIVTKKEVVLPSEVSKLVYPTDKPVLTLITCTPLGTAEKRLLVTAEQISPDPSAAKAAPEGSGNSSSDAAMPGTAPTLIERLFGAR